MIPESPTLYSTVFTVKRTVQKMTRSLGQNTTVITFDEAIYSKAREMFLFSDVVLRLGGFHKALIFLATIGKLSDGGGIMDILVESDIFGSAKVCQILKGKSYTRAVRAHKALTEGLIRLR